MCPVWLLSDGNEGQTVQKYKQLSQTPNNAKLLDKWKHPIKSLNDRPKTENPLWFFLFLHNKSAVITETRQPEWVSAPISYISNTSN